LVREEEQVIGRAISVRVVLTRTSPQVPTKNEKMIVEELRAACVPMLTTHLNQRTAYQSVFTYRVGLDELDPALVNGLEAAIANAYRLAGEVVEVIRDLSQGRAAA
jgi:chromosome partitioning protein